MVALLSSFASRAEAQTPDERKAACLSAYETSQVERKAGHLLQAREALAICTRDECPTLVRTDCAGWLADVDAALPSVVVQASADGAELTDVAVYVDGALVKTALDGKAIAVDPGPRAFRFVSRRAGLSPIEMPVVIREGEHYRALRVTFDTGARPPPLTESAPVPTSRPVPITAWIFGGVAIAATASFAAFAITGYERKETLRTHCAPFCDPSEVDTVQHRYFAADVSLAVAAASLGIATYFYLTRPEVPLRVGFAPLPRGSGGAIRISGGF